MKKQFCTHCMDDRECDYKERNKKLKIDKIEIEYLEKYYVCKTCGEELYGDLLDYNVREGNKKLREQTGLIQVSDIQAIIDKYGIGKKPLSLVLGLGEITITRYLDGQNPTKDNSELLKNILNNPILYEMYLEVNKDRITEIAYKKSLGKTKQIELKENKSKIYNVALYIINKVKEIDALSLQKILYYCELFSNKFLNKNILNINPEAWIYGPVYKDIYDSFSYYKYNKIDYNELLTNDKIDLDEKEKEYLDTIIKDFGYYSGSILREMTHLTDPWLNARQGLEPNEYSNRIIEEKDINKYADKIIDEYDIKELCDINKYSETLFNQAKNNLENKN